MDCNYCENNCTSRRNGCFYAEECNGWYFFQTYPTSHAHGINIGRKFVNEIDTKYKYGDFYTYCEFTKVYYDWPITEVTLDWQPLEKDYIPTFKDKVRKFFTRKPWPNKVDVRPENNTIVILRYGDDTHYEIAEYNERRWITNLSFPVRPSEWAYVPKEILDYAKTIKDGEK